MFSKPWDFDLPPESIAKYPVEPRDSCRLLLTHPHQETFTHHRFRDLTELLRPGDLLVLNETRVLPVRLFGKLPTGGKVEVFVLRTDPQPGPRHCLVRPGKKIRQSTPVRFPGNVQGDIRRDGDRFEVDFSLSGSEWVTWLEGVGEMPLPPYLGRPAEAKDHKDYQTVFAKEPGSVAAPTAGLHFTPHLLESLGAKGIELAKLTLHVGYGTFAPLPDQWENHELHREVFEVPPSVWEKVRQTQARGDRVIAVGTTAARALESSDPENLKGETQLFIRPGYEFRAVDGLITNFHLPRTSLLLLVAALLGEEATRKAYGEALEQGYRFYSYGDAMAILP